MRGGERGNCPLPKKGGEDKREKGRRTSRPPGLDPRRNAKVYRIAWLRQGHETRLTLRFVEVQWVNLLGPLTRGESKEFTSRLPALNRGVKGIRAHSVEGRREGRDRQQLRVLLASAGKPVLAESASTENISSCGARVRTGCRLQPETRLQTTRSEEHTSELQSRLHLVCR